MNSNVIHSVTSSATGYILTTCSHEINTTHYLTDRLTLIFYSLVICVIDWYMVQAYTKPKNICYQRDCSQVITQLITHVVADPMAASMWAALIVRDRPARGTRRSGRRANHQLPFTRHLSASEPKRARKGRWSRRQARQAAACMQPD